LGSKVPVVVIARHSFFFTSDFLSPYFEFSEKRKKKKVATTTPATTTSRIYTHTHTHYELKNKISTT
jgi:hypothetical protein